jgi:hypothetical protein
MLSRDMRDYTWGLVWGMDLLTTYTHNSELQAVNSIAANLHNSQITTASAKPFSSLLCLYQPFPGYSY